MVVDLVRLMLFPTLMAFAASSDLLTMTISNRVSIAVAVGFFVLALMSGWMGGGDAKLAAATAMWLGFDHLMNYLIYTSLLGGALTLMLIEFRLVPLPGLLAGQFWAQRLHRQGGDIPYGIALAGAALLVYPETPWMKAIGM